jgi:hypothetical protein
MSPAPTVAPRTAPQAQGTRNAPVPVIPFTRASRKKSRLAGQWGPITLNTAQQALPPIQLPAAGFARNIRLTVTGTTAGNSAATAFNADGPFNLLQQVSVLSANGDSLISPIDGFVLYVLNKYGCFASGTFDPVSVPSYSVTTGSGATGGSFKFEIVIPFEVDSRDAFCALQNMAANQSFLLQLSLNSIANLYTTAPTNAPAVSITAVMEYWAAPAANTATGEVQATFPPGNGSVSLIQTQTPSINPGTAQNIQLLNVGNTIRLPIFILRTSAGVRTEADWPSTTQFYVNNDPWLYKTKDQWRTDMARDYRLTGGLSATPALNTLDNGVFVLSDFINEGASGDHKADGSSNRNLFLVTGSATAFNIEASTPWGASASSLLCVQNTIRPSSPQAMYTPHLI